MLALAKKKFWKKFYIHRLLFVERYSQEKRLFRNRSVLLHEILLIKIRALTYQILDLLFFKNVFYLILEANHSQRET